MTRLPERFPKSDKKPEALEDGARYAFAARACKWKSIQKHRADLVFEMFAQKLSRPQANGHAAFSEVLRWDIGR